LKNQTINHSSVRYNKDPGSTDKIRYKWHLLIRWPLFYAERNHNIHWPELVRMPQTKPAAERPFVTGNNPPPLPASNQIIDSLTQQLTSPWQFLRVRMQFSKHPPQNVIAQYIVRMMQNL
jgi:hypothetical protein